MQISRRARDVLFVLLGVGGLVLKGRYSGPVDELVQSYGGNVAVALALMVVQLFEVLDGFGIMKNVYDRFDLAANTAGIGLAIGLDGVVSRMSEGRSASVQGPSTGSGEVV